MTVHRKLVDSGQDILLETRKIVIDCETPSHRINCTRITTDPSNLKKKIAGQHCPRLCHSCQWHQCQRHRKWRRHRRSHLIHPLWQDPVVPKLIVHSSEFYSMDSLASECCFFNAALGIGEQDDVPTETDVLRPRQKSMGVPKVPLDLISKKYIMALYVSQLGAALHHT